MWSLLGLVAHGFEAPTEQAAINHWFAIGPAIGLLIAGLKHDGDWLLTATRYFFFAALGTAPAFIAWDTYELWPYTNLVEGEAPGELLITAACSILPGIAFFAVKKRWPAQLFDLIYGRSTRAATDTHVKASVAPDLADSND